MKIKLNASIKCKDHDGYKAQEVNELMWGLKAHQGDFIECQTPDGPSDDNEYYIVLTNWFTGEEYQLTHPVRGRIRYEEDEEFDEEDEDMDDIDEVIAKEDEDEEEELDHYASELSDFEDEDIDEDVEIDEEDDELVDDEEEDFEEYDENEEDED